MDTFNQIEISIHFYRLKIAPQSCESKYRIMLTYKYTLNCYRVYFVTLVG